MGYLNIGVKNMGIIIYFKDGSKIVDEDIRNLNAFCWKLGNSQWYISKEGVAFNINEIIKVKEY
jgi:hypothetical protein